jgi:hypothetical protein
MILGHVAGMEAKQNACSVLVGMPEIKRQLEDIIKMDFREIQ